MNQKMPSQEMYEFAKELFPICRSLTGEGVRETLRLIQRKIPIVIKEAPSGTACFDWNIPKEWEIKEAYIENETGEKIIDFKRNNLHVVGYSEPVDTWMTLEELEPHLFSLPELPTAIPYITSYYKVFWGFCLSHQQKLSLKKGKYRVKIESRLFDGKMNYAELLIPGKSKKEILLSTYICHPSMANNELSGPVLATELAKWILTEERNLSYRILFLPETIGSIYYLSRHLEEMKKNILAGFQLTCVGDNRQFSFLASRLENTLADQVALHVLKHKVKEFKSYSFLERGSDERQYCSPGVDLPFVSIMRSKYDTYPEYHTSLDNLDFISAQGLGESFEVYKHCLQLLENNEIYKLNTLCEPRLGKRGLYPQTSEKNTWEIVKDMMNVIAYCDGKATVLEISEKIGISYDKTLEVLHKLKEAQLAEVVP